jgi:hypothetical protein
MDSLAAGDGVVVACGGGAHEATTAATTSASGTRARIGLTILAV